MNEPSKLNDYAVEFRGEPIVGLKFESRTGKPDFTTGALDDAIRYTLQEAIECAEAVRGEVVNIIEAV